MICICTKLYLNEFRINLNSDTKILLTYVWINFESWHKVLLICIWINLSTNKDFIDMRFELILNSDSFILLICALWINFKFWHKGFIDMHFKLIFEFWHKGFIDINMHFKMGLNFDKGFIDMCFEFKIYYLSQYISDWWVFFFFNIKYMVF